MAEQVYLPLWSAVMPLRRRVAPLWWKAGSPSLCHSTLKGHGFARILHVTSTSLSPSLTSRRCGSVMMGSCRTSRVSSAFPTCREMFTRYQHLCPVNQVT